MAWIPAFALDRTQKILYELRTAQREGLLPAGTPIYCPSPSGNEISGIYRDHQAEWFLPSAAMDPYSFAPPGLVNRLPREGVRGPAVVVSTSGMMDAAFAERLAPLLEDGRSGVFLVGYQDPATPGWQLQHDWRRVRIGGQDYDVAAQVRTYGCFSGHGDAADIDQWLAAQPAHATIVLVPGDEEAVADRAAELRRRWSVVTPAPGQSIPLSAVQVRRR